MMKVLFTILIGCSMLSCSPKVVSLSKLKSEYEFIDFEGYTYFARKSDTPMLSKMPIDCIAQKDDHLKTWTGEGPVVRDVTKWGLEMKDLIGLKNEDYYYAYTMVFDETGKTILARIINSDIDIHKEGSLYVLHRILQTEATPISKGFSCLSMRIEVKNNYNTARISSL